MRHRANLDLSGHTIALPTMKCTTENRYRASSYQSSSINGSFLSRVYTYVRGNWHDEQADWLRCGKNYADLVVGKGKCFKHVVTNGLKKCSREGTFIAPESVKITPKSGGGQTEKPKCDIPPNIAPKIVTVANWPISVAEETQIGRWIFGVTVFGAILGGIPLSGVCSINKEL